jgi:uncharacterized C2H2 Zn-finger protein
MSVKYAVNRILEKTVLKHKVTHGITDKLKCENCPTEFTLRKNYMRHQQESYDEEGNPRNNCPVCDKTCCTGKHLIAHLNLVHNEEFYCTVQFKASLGTPLDKQKFNCM